MCYQVIRWSILHNPSQSGWMAKSAVEVSEYDVEYRARTSMKSQVLVDFLIEIPKFLRSVSKAGNSGTTIEALPSPW